MTRTAWTKRCAGTLCANRTPFSQPYFIPDEQTLCDACLLDTVDLYTKTGYDSCDRDGIGPEYVEVDDVVAALRRVTGK